MVEEEECATTVADEDVVEEEKTVNIVIAGEDVVRDESVVNAGEIFESSV